MRNVGRAISRALWGCGVLVGLMALAGCDTAEPPLAPYEGERPLIIRGLTQSFAPDIQWVGGRVAAVGINEGDQAALDSTLVWMYQADGDEISGPVYVRDVLDADAVMKAGGTPRDSLTDDQVYTLWLATKSALDASLQESALDEFSFADTTFTARYLLSGRSAGGVDVEFTIYRDERLTSDKFVVAWTPADQAFRRVAIRNATVGGFTDLLWHIVLPDEMQDAITSPLVIGEALSDAIVATPWAGFGEGTHVLWAATSEWDGDSFGFRTDGYAFYQIFASNFE